MPADDTNLTTELFSPGLSEALADRETDQVQEQLNEPAPPIDFSPGSPASHVSSEAYALIVRHETGGRPYYERVYRSRPVWPGGSSGITIGFGYDLGYHAIDTFRLDWAVLGEATTVKTGLRYRQTRRRRYRRFGAEGFR